MRSLLPHQLKKRLNDTKSCVVVNVAFILKVYIHHWYPGMIGIWKNWNITAKMIKAEGLVKNYITCMKHIRIQWCNMGVIFIPNHLIWQNLQCAHIHSMIMHFHTEEVYCGDVPTFHLSIFLTKKQIKKWMKTPWIRFHIYEIIAHCTDNGRIPLKDKKNMSHV